MNNENHLSDFPTSGHSDIHKTPKSQGYVFPAEWEEHEANGFLGLTKKNLGQVN